MPISPSFVPSTIILEDNAIGNMNTWGLFFTQFTALFWKNWIILSRHKLPNVSSCVLLPIAYGVFLTAGQNFFKRPSNYGMGSPASIYNFTTQFDGSLPLLWTDSTNGTGNPSADAIVSYITSRFDEHKMVAVKQVASHADIISNCSQNFLFVSNCYAGIAFNYLPVSPTDPTPINYTIIADRGVTHFDVYRHTSDQETRILPLQLVIDEAIIALGAGQSIPTPLEWPYTQENNQQRSTEIRLSYIRGIRSLIVIACFVNYIGIAYKLPGAFAGERATQLTSHMKAMGLLDSARIISWHVSISLVYFPAWILVAFIWHRRIFTETNVGLVLAVHLLLGLSLASWSFFVSAPFGKSPQLAAIVSTALSILFAILALVFSRATTGAAVIFTLIFPPGYYIFAIRAICGYENHLMPTSLLKPDPDHQLTLLPIMITCIINIFLWPYLGALLERCLYDASEPLCYCDQNKDDLPVHPTGVAISIKKLRKIYTPSMFSRGKTPTTVISELSLDIPKSGIFVMLGSNGAGKSTTLSIIANLLGRSSGHITFEGGAKRPPPGMLGIVPQKNVLFPDLTCFQTLRVWHAIKRSSHSTSDDGNYEQLLLDCDLGKKIHSNANTLSGGQKRRLQLAIGLVGGSKIVLVDEATSGVDPLSRRAIWKILTSVKHDRTIVFTTHFLDEADLLGDHIAVLTAPGKLLAEGSPIALKTSLGQGYSIQVTFDPKELGENDSTKLSLEVLNRIRELAPQCTLSPSSLPRAAYHLKSKDSVVVEKVLRLLDYGAEDYYILSVDVLGTTIEGIFLDLMESVDSVYMPNTGEKKVDSTGSILSADLLDFPQTSSPLMLADGRTRSPFSQALTIFYKRTLIARRSWLTPVLAVLIAICGACTPLFYLSGLTPSCTFESKNDTAIPLYWPLSPIRALNYAPNARIIESPPDITSTLDHRSNAFMLMENVPDNNTFVSTIRQDYLNIPVGGISINMQTGDALVAWHASPQTLTGFTMLNLATNILYNRALNASSNPPDSPNIIAANYLTLPSNLTSTITVLKWATFFGTSIAVYPAFFALYVSQERQSAVQAMQLSNGLSNLIGLWLGHLLWDSIFGVIVATIIITIFATVSNQFYGLGLFWIVLVQYGVVGVLLSYCVSLFMPSPIMAFAATAVYQTVMFLLYLGSYLLTSTYSKATRAGPIITIIHFTLSILSPIASVMRSVFVSVDLFSLLCDGPTPITVSHLGDIMRYGGPILYLFIDGIVLFGILVCADSKYTIPRFLAEMQKQRRSFTSNEIPKQDVVREVKAVEQSRDELRVLHVTKSYGGQKVVDDVSFGVPQGVIFAMLGPNGAGKTTTFNMIRRDVIPDTGDIKVKGVSVVNSPRNTRLSLGVCPQFTAIDTQLTVREHLMIYGRLRGLAHGPELNDNVESLMVAVSLNMYADRLANQLSDGNQRKLALAIALMGNPSVLLIDEFSTGVDAKMKRELWRTLRSVTPGKAIVITTHSMEEASALANKVGILSKKMLSIGTTEELAARYDAYHVQFPCHTREDLLGAQTLMSRIPGARLVEDVATRFEVPIRRAGNRTNEDGVMSLAQLFHVLASDGRSSGYTVEKAQLENVFLNVIRENSVLERDSTP